MTSSDRPLATFYRLSIVTVSASAAVWLKFSVESFKLYIRGRIWETVRDRAKVTINH